MRNMLDDLITEINHFEEAETDEIRKKIRSERRYFASIMSTEDFERFKNLETLHGEGHNIRYRNMFIYAFNLGVAFIAVLNHSPLPHTEKRDA